MDFKEFGRTISSFILGFCGYLGLAVASLALKEIARPLYAATPVCPRYIPTPLWIDLIPWILPAAAIALILKVWSNNPFQWKTVVAGLVAGFILAGIISTSFEVSTMRIAPSYANEVLPNYLQALQHKGHGLATARICFEPNEPILLQDLRELISIPGNGLQATCGNDLICGPGGIISIDDNRIVASSQAHAYATICANAEKPNPPQYCISIASNASNAQSNCVKLCEIS